MKLKMLLCVLMWAVVGVAARIIEVLGFDTSVRSAS